MASERIEVFALEQGETGLFSRPVRPGAEVIFGNQAASEITFDFGDESPFVDGSTQVPVPSNGTRTQQVANDATGPFPYKIVSGTTTYPMLLEVEPNGIAKFGVRVASPDAIGLEVTIEIYSPSSRALEIIFQNKLAGVQPKLNVRAKLLSERVFLLQMVEQGILPPFVVNGENSGLALRAELLMNPNILQNGGGTYVEIIIDP